jgi:ketosteroid isomerase-like protein
MDHHELLTQAYAAFNARDLESALQTMHEDVDWPNGMEGGRVRGHAGVRDYWTRQWSLIDPKVDPVGFSEAPDGVTVVKVNQVVRSLEGGVLMDGQVEHAYRIEEGLIRSMEIREASDFRSN